MRVLATVATGFVGRRLVPALVDGPEVVTYPETIRRTGRHLGNEPAVGTDDRLPHLVPVDPTPSDEAIRRAPTDRSVEAAA